MAAGSAVAAIASGVIFGQATASREAGAEATAALAQGTGLDHAQLVAYDQVTTARAHSAAESILAEANAVLASAPESVDATGLVTSVASLSNYQVLDSAGTLSLVADTRGHLAEVTAAAEAAAAQAAADAAQEQANANTPDGARATARQLAASEHGWGESQFSCLASLWQKESGWSHTAYNTSSGATGIPQALPGSKMAAAGSDWATNATTQIRWGLDYIARGYGTPCSAWSHSQSVNWY